MSRPLPKTNCLGSSVIGFLFVFAASPALALSPCVRFDVAEVVACRDVTTPEFRGANPGDKLVEARIHVSSLVDLGHEDSLVQFLYLFENPTRTLHVIDYFPRTQLEAHVAGKIAVEKTRSKKSSFGLNASGGYDQVSADATASKGHSATDALRYELLPPMQLLAASGTLRRGAAVYYKLKPSPRAALDGSKEFTIVARVPVSWRGDVLRVRLAAFDGDRRISWQVDPEPICGSAEFAVALHLEADTEAEQRAWEFVRRDRQLRHLARSRRRAIEESKFPSLGHKLGSMIAVVKPKVPDGWLENVFDTWHQSRSPGFSRYLPDDVRSAIGEYRTARQQLHRLTGYDG